MRNLLKSNWLLIANTGPLLLLAALCYGEFSVIQTLLPAASVGLWQVFGVALAGLGGASLAYLGWCWARGQALSTGYAVATLVAYSLFLGLYTYHSQEILPRSVPRWMVPTDVLVYVWTFVMPTLAHALLVLVVRTTPAGRPASMAGNVLLALALPIGWYVLVAMLGPLGHFESPALKAVLLVAAVAVSPLVFLYFVARSVYISLQRRASDEVGIILGA